MQNEEIISVTSNPTRLDYRSWEFLLQLFERLETKGDRCEERDDIAGERKLLGKLREKEVFIALSGND